MLTVSNSTLKILKLSPDIKQLLEEQLEMLIVVVP